ncbi:MAG: 30S ribosomal protein S4 [Omnitrophica bacterium RIFCSPLOWO2_12_FULL_44_17]|uniref:Small ribosomal subunit protein uS4 n=1 Tax=Candidatus Danuiimicrobium aquiferis TaxID=1801832 RepID=A0A1G1L0S6_9BACT|nr:MAG: 30S ribosomal protein S4 [Omnitrophica bacterium RIFCSPHIGHO2_02_FULL_45_28]OGW90894.1 MAG: 30S ribosomal protein S4 [Omnitrophica bacterium RIFCSPHIGHO2_12_FULL_44_12]OGW98489.1 MAG: 30S ribosomal protein S4 [Omnitrophica bacterium RIFCSPLOWO2_12_FULL_44_17]OGX02935.1 MAG: 30S ribosomal protein S4 [Omnitrophica bacterium RIFCSPLOWO2_02_FULL_44_11]
MGRYTGPAHRQSRREGVILSGHRVNDKKERRLSQLPGQHWDKRSKLSDYAVQLREKQKMKRIYGMYERQFRKFFEQAAKKKGVTGETLIQLLERRLDNVVFRIFFAATRREARQMVGHGLIYVNGHRLDIPSCVVDVGDVIEPRPKEANIKRVRARLEQYPDLKIPEWLTLDKNSLKATVLRMPSKADAALPVEESMIVELYSK